MEKPTASCSTAQISEVSDWCPRLPRLSGKILSEGRRVTLKVYEYDLVSTSEGPESREPSEIFEATHSERSSTTRRSQLGKDRTTLVARAL
jgi:hypothetical protein